MPPDFSRFPDMLWPALETVDIAIFGTVAGVCMAVPLAVLAAANVTPSRVVYFLSRGIIGVARSVPDLVWALLFVTAVGLGPFPGGAGAGGALDRHAGPFVRRNDREHGHGADRRAVADRREPHAGVHARRGADRAAGAAGDRAVPAGREHPRRRWCWALSAPAGSGSSC